MPRAHDTEVSLIQCRDLIDAQALGEGDDRGIGGAEWEVVVLRDQRGDAGDVSARQVDELELPSATASRKATSANVPTFASSM